TWQRAKSLKKQIVHCFCNEKNKYKKRRGLMSRLKKFWLTFVSIISAVCLMAGMGLHIAFADDPEPENGYSDKLIARYTLDEIREETDEEQTIKYFDAIDKLTLLTKT